MLHAQRTAFSDTSGQSKGFLMASEPAIRKGCRLKWLVKHDPTNEETIDCILLVTADHGLKTGSEGWGQWV